MAGVFPLLFTDECIDGPIVQALREHGWDVEHATEVFGERTSDPRIFEYAAQNGRVLVTTDQDHLKTADEWAKSGRRFRMIFWEQEKTQRILVSVVVEAFEDIATKPDAFVYPIEYLKITRLERGPR